MPDASPLIRSAARTAAAADRISATFARQLASVLRTTDLKVRAWLSQPTPRLVSPPTNDVRQWLREAGYDALADAATDAPFNAMAERVIAQRTAADVPVDHSPLAAARLQAWRGLHLDDLGMEANVLAQRLTQALARGLVGPRALTQVSSDLKDILDSADSRIATIYDTAVSIYGRQVEADQAGDEGGTTFTYMGPVDDKTRDFCLDLVGGVFTRDEIDGMDNGQISNVFLSGGGYNCRHVWMEVSKFSELHPKANTAYRVPEIAVAVQEVRAA